MRPDEFIERFRRFCADELGPDMGPRVGALARRGFDLHPADVDDVPAGRSCFGGTALLAPGTPWPEGENGPMPLLAVLDTAALRTGLDVELPRGAQLLNFFYEGHEEGIAEDIREGWTIGFEGPCTWKVVPADPAVAQETAPPTQDILIPARPVRADPMVALPDPHSTFNEPSPTEEKELWEAFERMQQRLPEIVGDATAWPFHNVPHRIDSDRAAGNRAFGWAWPMQGGPVTAENRVHLLQLDSDAHWKWADGGMVTFDIPAAALREGDFDQAGCYLASC
ncbi:DUF1963 domain-containing protein [Nocardiopsis suaedae]|uniref:DUF1963 domain-containing protein n=1 Tax=Nocardiopsis suaedae TaxID=3018444 RepID=A0ABT4TFV5_9ACTN|nr:DUF1963 domain-containing protein [Nocardiopsis suaedae]MDA2803578.1 DUF1963 domain-containing protein [Nocardiopsis suaedae]